MYQHVHDGFQNCFHLTDQGLLNSSPFPCAGLGGSGRGQQNEVGGIEHVDTHTCLWDST
jgi:hypothetical protein